METKASYVLVGAFTMLILLVFAGLLIFSAKSGSDESSLRYVINFQGGVSGLSVGNDVRFNGIRVGQVSKVNISREDPSMVQVVISIAKETPVREDSEATLQFQGITGLSVVSITGGSVNSPILRSKNGTDLPEIKAGKSTLDHLMAEAPNLVVSANILMQRAAEVFSPENQENLRITLENLARLSGNLAEQSDNLAETLENLNKASKTIGSFLDSASSMVSDIKLAADKASAAFKAISQAVENANPGIESFVNAGFDELGRVIGEGERLLRSLEVLVRKIDNNPRVFFFGDNVPEYKAP